eukprot:1531099-Prymnesium_polylepis.1
MSGRDVLSTQGMFCLRRGCFVYARARGTRVYCINETLKSRQPGSARAGPSQESGTTSKHALHLIWPLRRASRPECGTPPALSAGRLPPPAHDASRPQNGTPPALSGAPARARGHSAYSASGWAPSWAPSSGRAGSSDR